MDPQVIVIGAVVFVVSAVLIYLISAFTMREKTFEEVIAEQKKRNEEEREKARQKKELKKKPKKAKEKSKEKTAQVQASEPEVKPHKMVNLELDPEIIEPLEEALEPKPKAKKKHSKSILVNKEEEPAIADHPKEFKHTGPPPKDDVEMKHEHDKMKQQKHEPTKMKKEGRHEKHQQHEAEQVPVVEEMVTQAVSKVQAASPPVKEDRRRTKMDEVQSGRNTDLILAVQKASLVEDEVQTLIDILQNKQGPVQNWNMKSQKGDPVSQLRKQLEEKERALQEEQQLAMSAGARIKEMKHEISQEKLRYNSIEKNYKDKIEFQGQEIQALHSRIQQAHETHMVEASQLRAHIQQLEAQKDQTRLQRLAEDNKMLRESLAKAQSDATNAPEMTKLKDTVNILQKELSSNVMKLNAMENGKKTMEQKIAKLEEEKKKLGAAQQSSESVLEKRVDEVNQELRKSETKNKSLDKELQSAKKSFDSAHNECAALKNKLKELEQALSTGDTSTKEMEEKLKEAQKNKSDMESNLKNMEKKFNEAEKQRKETENELKALQQENSILVSDLKVTRERQAGEGQEAPPKGAPNGDLQSETAEDTNKILRTEHEKLISEKNSEINQLVSELESRESSLTAKESELKKLLTEVDSWKSEVSQKDSEISQYKSELNSKEAQTSGVSEQLNELKSEIDSSKSQISQLQKDLDLQKKKNNELREKNWKAMDALEKSEKSVSEKVKSAIKTETEQLDASQSEDREILKRLFPTVVIKENPCHKDWMSQFEKETSVYISSLCSQPKEDNSAKYESKIQQLETESSRLLSQLRETEVSRDEVQSQLTQLEDGNSKLQSQVAQYRSVLGETENKLTQLENSVESEEKKWQERLQAKELEMEQIKQETVSLREQVLQSKGSSENEIKIQTLEGQLKASEDRCTEQLEELRKLLEAEQKKNKDLASNIVKLNGIIKTGHDALMQEQELVKKLTSQNANSSVPSESNTEVSVTEL